MCRKYRRRRNNFFYKASSQFFLILILFFLFSCKGTETINSDMPVIASVTSLHNEVKRRLHKRIDWNQVDLNSNLFQKDTLMTLDKSKAVITFQDRSKINLDENSLIVIERPEKIVKKIDTRVHLKEGTFNRTFSSKGDRVYISEITTDRVVTYISSQKGKVGLKYKKNKKLKIAVYSGNTQINTVVKKRDVETKDNTNDLLEVAVYKGGKAEVKMDVVNEKKDEVETKVIQLKEKDLIQVDHKNEPKTIEPIKNEKGIDIMKEEFPEETVKQQLEKEAKQVELNKKQEEEKKKVKNNKISVFLKKDKFIFLTWKKIDGASKYFLDISKTKSFRSVFETKIVKDNKLKISIKKFSAGTYYWQVAPIIGGEIKEYGKVQKFKVSN